MKRFKVFISLILVTVLFTFAFSGFECFAAYNSENVCLHENAEWTLAFPPTPVTDAYYFRECPECGFSQTAKKARTSFVVRLMDLFAGLFIPSPEKGLSEDFTVTAHTGPGEMKMNSISSLLYSLNCGADVVEFDLCLNADGVAVMAHDSSEKAGGTLETAFAMISKYKDVRVNVDVKSIEAVSIAQELAVKYGILDRIFYTGVNDRNFAYVKEHSPLVDCYLNIEAPSDPDECVRVCEQAVEMGAAGLNFSYTAYSPALAEAARANGLLLSVYTVNKPSEQLMCLDYDIDNITTEFPFILFLLSGKSNPYVDIGRLFRSSGIFC